MGSTMQQQGTTADKADVAAGHWGIEPVPQEHRRFSAIDLGILWGDLGIGLLVIATGMLLVAPSKFFGFGLTLPAAIATTVIGSIVGSLLLAYGGVIGAREGRPTMVLLRPVLGTKGSWIPSIFNVIQLLGWTAFELWAMALVADKLGQKLFGFSSFIFWLLAFAVVTLGLSLWGPLGVVRAWMEKFGAWLVAAIGLLVTIYVVTHIQLGQLWSRPGLGGAAVFGLPLDLVIVMPVSWLPLVADYNRFAKSVKGAFRGTFIGYAIANIWFYLLGALMFFAIPKIDPTPAGIASGILAIGGVALTGIVLLAGLLVGETDEAFADVYSAGMSIKNILPSVDNRVLVTGVTIVATALAGRLSMDAFETFLFLLGSIFMPLFGVWFADHFVLHNDGSDQRSFRAASLVPWVAGFFVYHWINPTGPGWWIELFASAGKPLAAKVTWLGASLPSFAAAFILHLVIARLTAGMGRGGPKAPSLSADRHR